MSRRASLLLKLVLTTLGIALFAGLLWSAGPRAIWEQLRGFGWGILLLLVPSVVMYGVETLSWAYSFRERPPVGFLRLCAVRAAGESLNATLPAAYMGGEPVKALLLEQAGGSGAEGLASVVVAKTALTVGQIVFVVAGIVAASLTLGDTMEGAAKRALLVGAGVCVFLGTVSIYLAYLAQRHGLGRLLQRFVARVGVGRQLVESRRESLARLDEALAGFYAQRSGRFWLASGLALLGWLCEVGEVFLFARFLDLPLGGLEIFAIAGLASVVKAAGFIIPASLGAQEGGNVLLFLAFGLDEVTGLGFSVVRRFRELVWIGLGLLILAGLGLPARARADAAPPAEA